MKDLESGLKQLFEERASSVAPTSGRNEVVFRKVRRRRIRNGVASTLAVAVLVAGGFAGASQLSGEPVDLGPAGGGGIEGSEEKSAEAVATFPSRGTYDGLEWEFRAREGACIEFAFVRDEGESGTGTCELGRRELRFDEMLHRGVHVVVGDVTPDAASLEVDVMSIEGPESYESPVYSHPRTDERRFFVAFAPKFGELTLTFRSEDGEVVAEHTIGPYGPEFMPPENDCPPLEIEHEGEGSEEVETICEMTPEGHMTITGTDSAEGSASSEEEQEVRDAERRMRRQKRAMKRAMEDDKN